MYLRHFGIELSELDSDESESLSELDIEESWCLGRGGDFSVFSGSGVSE